jgi:hypothetical protein
MRRGRLALLLCGALVFVAFDCWLLMPPYTNTGFDEFLFAGLGLPFFGLAALFILSRLLSRKPALVIDASGITDNGSLVAAGFIPWSDFADAGIASVGKTRFLGIRLRDPDAYLARSNALKRFLVQINMQLCGYPCNIPVTTLPCTVEELLATVKQHAAQRAG